MAEHPVILQAHDLEISLGGSSLLQGLSFEARQERFHVIAGPNGAGKSTLMRALLGILPIDAGAIELCGRSLLSLPPRERARLVAYVPQHTLLDAALPVIEVVCQGRFMHDESDGRSREVASSVLQKLGINNLHGRPFTQLSGGEQRLTLIARALATQAPLLLLDEPTASLDIAHRLQTLRLLKNLIDDEGRTIVCVLHDLADIFAYADDVTLLHRGSHLATGTASDVLSSERLRGVYGVVSRPNSAPSFALPEPS